MHTLQLDFIGVERKKSIQLISGPKGNYIIAKQSRNVSIHGKY